jgi:hypothetical protein
MPKVYRHVGVLFMLAVVALGLLGAAYTLWYEDLSIEADVTTGVFDANWTLTGAASAPKYAVVSGSSATPAFGDFTDTEAAKLASLTCGQSISSSGAGVGANDTGSNNVLTLEMTNLYPFTGCLFTVNFGLANDSTVPAHFQITSASKSDYLVVLPGAGQPTYCTAIVDALNGPFTPPVALMDGANALQLHPNEWEDCTFLVYLKEVVGGNTVQEGAAAGTYTLALTIKAHQWNETP